jgi:hypothetical protein
MVLKRERHTFCQQMKSMDIFGNTDSKKMPKHLFWGALNVNHETAIRGTPEKQNYSVCPRHWYVDADFKCDRCTREYTWTAAEQKVWFEDYFFWVDSQPRHCKSCRIELRQLSRLRQEYDATVAAARNRGSSDQKRRITEIINELGRELGQLPDKMTETKELFERQITKRAEQAPPPYSSPGAGSESGEA